MSEKDLEMNSNNYDGILEEAQKEEYRIKSLSRREKEKLISEN